MIPPPITHVIFDFDGLLINTESLYTIANTMMLAKFEVEFTKDMKRGMMGKKHDEAVEWLIKAAGIEDRITTKKYLVEYDEWLDKAFVSAVAMPGAQRLVEHLAMHNIPIAICTGSCSRTFALKNTCLKEWTKLIPIQVYTGDDPNVKNGKPHPEPYLYTMKQFSVPPASPANVLVFEDAPNGVESALAAGMQCVMVPDLTVVDPKPDFRARLQGCLYSLEDFKPEEFCLPPFK